MKGAREQLAELMAIEPPPGLDCLVHERALDVFARCAKPSAPADCSDRIAEPTPAELRLEGSRARRTRFWGPGLIYTTPRGASGR